MQAQEFIHYQDGTITITNARAVLGSKTYAMANVTSVSTGVIPANRIFGILVAVFGLLIAACGGVGLLVPLSTSASSTGDDAIVLMVLTCGSVAALGFLMLVVGVLLAVLPKTRYAVRIGSSSGETDALVSKDQAYIEKIVIAMNEAIINRG